MENNLQIFEVDNQAEILSIMATPNDLLRARGMAKAALNNLLDVDGDVSKASVYQDHLKEVKKALWPGLVVGTIFSVALWKGMSLGKAQNYTTKEMNGFIYLGKKRYLSVETTRRFWREYKNVAHLWAAHSLIRRETPNYFVEIVQLSERFHNQAIQRGGFPNWKPYFAGTISRPKGGNVPFNDELPKGLAKLLKEYVPHSKKYKK